MECRQGKNELKDPSVSSAEEEVQNEAKDVK